MRWREARLPFAGPITVALPEEPIVEDGRRPSNVLDADGLIVWRDDEGASWVRVEEPDEPLFGRVRYYHELPKFLRVLVLLGLGRLVVLYERIRSGRGA